MEMRLSAAEFAAWLKGRVGEGCIAGCSGQDADFLPEWKLSGQYAGRQLDCARRWSGRVWDSPGLAAGFCRDRTGLDISAPVHYAFRRWCGIRGRGELPPEYRLPGAALFRIGDEAFHMGFLADEDTVVEARSPERGVILGSLRDGWNGWGLMTRYFDYGEVPDAKFPLGGRLIKAGCAGGDVLQLQRLMNALGWAVPESGIFCGETAHMLKYMQAALDLRCDGVYDEKTHAALAARLQLSDLCPAAAVHALPAADSPVIAFAREDMELESIGEYENWACVRLLGRTGWMKRKSCEVRRDG